MSMSANKAIESLRASLPSLQLAATPTDPTKPSIASNVMGDPERGSESEEESALDRRILGHRDLKKAVNALRKSKVDCEPILAAFKDFVQTESRKGRDDVRTRLAHLITSHDSQVADAVAKAGEAAAALKATLTHATSKALLKQNKAEERWQSDLSFLSDLIADVSAIERDAKAIDDKMRELRR